MSEKSPQLEQLQRAIDIMGSQAKLAKACNAKQQHVWNWLNRYDNVPVDRAIQIEIATNGEVTKESLNPEFFTGLPPIKIMLRKSKGGSL